MDFNSKEGIENHLKESGLLGLHEIAAARREAASSGFRLNWFSIRGEWALDEMGQTTRIERPYDSRNVALLAELAEVPLIMTREELHQHANEFSLVWAGGGANIPPTGHSRCAECGQGWSIETAWATKLESHSINVDKHLVEGMTKSEVNTWLNQTKWSGCFVADMKEGHSREKPERFILVIVRQWTHFSCARAKLLREENTWVKERIQKALAHALCGSVSFVMKDIPNEYTKEDWGPNWFHVTFTGKGLGDVVIGRRKNVYEVRWEADVDGEKLFAREDVTKGKRYIHAWTGDKIEEYLSAIFSATKG